MNKIVRNIIKEAINNIISESAKAVEMPSWITQNANVTIKNGKIRLYHFGTDDGTGYLNPQKFGSNSYTSDVRQWGQPRVMFYVNKKDKEMRVSGNLYIVDYPLNKLYPFNSDPSMFYEECQGELGMEDIPINLQISCIGDKVVKAGYDGIIFKWGDTLRIDIFKSVKVK